MGEGELQDDLLARVRAGIAQRGLAGPETPVLLMVSGGSDSTALAYLAADLREAGEIGPLAILHVNHLLRGRDADDDARFVAQLARLLGISLHSREIDVGAIAKLEGGNLEAVARRERYAAASEALAELCRRAGAPIAEGRIFTAHTADDRVENFYMRSIVGTGPGGFRSMRRLNGAVARPLLDIGREELRTWLQRRADAGAPMARDDAGALWREDATNAHTDRFRAYVRTQIVPLAKERNPRLLETLGRSMDLIGDEDDMLEDMAADLEARHVAWIAEAEGRAPNPEEGCVLAPGLGGEPLPLQRRVVLRVLRAILGAGARVESASVEAVLAAWEPAGEGDDAEGGADAAPRIRSGYVTNIQGDLAVSANKRGVRIEPMAAFRARRKKDR